VVNEVVAVTSVVHKMEVDMAVEVAFNTSLVARREEAMLTEEIP